MLKPLDQFHETEDTFDIPSYFEGRTLAFGVFQDRFGRIRRKLRVEMEGHWDGDKFLLNEEFSYDDGRCETRLWTVRPQADGDFTAVSADSVGAARGHAGPHEIRMAYTFRLRMKKRDIDVQFDDRLYPIDKRRVVNRAVMSKWGVKLGEVLLFFEKQNQP